MKVKLIVLLLLINVSIYSQTIKVACMEDIEPISFINDLGEPDGLYVDIIKKIAEKEDFNIEWIVGTWSENYNRLLNGEIDLMPAILKTSEREKLFTFNDIHVMTSWSAVYLPYNSDIKNILDLENKKIGLMIQDQNAENFRYLAQGFNIKYINVTVRSYDELLRLLRDGKIDAGIFFNLYGAGKEGIKESAIMFNPSNSYFAIPKDSGKEYILDTIDNYLYLWKLDKDSYFYYFYEKWFDLNAINQPIPKWLIYILIVSSVISTLFTLFIFVLKSTVRKKTKQLKDLNDNLELRIEESLDKILDIEKIALSAKLVTGVAHEINTPIGIGISSVTYLKDQTIDAIKMFKQNELTREELISYFDTSIQFFDIMFSNLQRATKLIDNFKQISSDNIAQEKRKINLKEYIEKIITSLTPEIKKSNFIIGIDLEDNIIINTYPDIFSQIFINLIMNSKIHAFNNESILPHIKISLRRIKNHIEIRYDDNGSGINLEDQDKIFDPFYTTNKKGGNIGLGLTIIYNLIKDKLKGSIKVESRVGKYTKFIIKFPIMEE